MNNILLSIFGTVVLYGLALLLQKKSKLSFLNPLLISSLVMIGILKILNISYTEYNEGAKFLTLLIGPATVALAIPLYQYFEVLKKHYKIIGITIVLGALIHAITITALIFIMNSDKQLLATFLPKSVTTPIAKEIAVQLGGIEQLTIVVVIVTGVFGSVIAPYVFKAFNIKSSIAQGLSLGISAHAVGTSKAVELGEIQTTMATLGLILSGILTVLIAPIFYNIFSGLL
ncbi:Integral membrane protein [Alteracholeplasma palmae J233]|uniref:Integral membrane protein n=1 Tax=Alteracholeplasma palmae (strain ATCC 49389 / J233) TaxID=1318466 RepID=U4KR88_ALTPJ|nr:LrgB family protein [Alteracholeplasma palmae]CCV63946.1 Integral membrane protein [Alteracholeplasma palmae J233]